MIVYNKKEKILANDTSVGVLGQVRNPVQLVYIGGLSIYTLNRMAYTHITIPKIELRDEKVDEDKFFKMGVFCAIGDRENSMKDNTKHIKWVRTSHLVSNKKLLLNLLKSEFNRVYENRTAIKVYKDDLKFNTMYAQLRKKTRGFTQLPDEALQSKSALRAFLRGYIAFAQSKMGVVVKDFTVSADISLLLHAIWGYPVRHFWRGKTEKYIASSREQLLLLVLDKKYGKEFNLEINGGYYKLPAVRDKYSLYTMYIIPSVRYNVEISNEWEYLFKPDINIAKTLTF